jgi:hypothetical protein
MNEWMLGRAGSVSSRKRTTQYEVKEKEKRSVVLSCLVYVCGKKKKETQKYQRRRRKSQSPE